MRKLSFNLVKISSSGKNNQMMSYFVNNNTSHNINRMKLNIFPATSSLSSSSLYLRGLYSFSNHNKPPIKDQEETKPNHREQEEKQQHIENAEMVSEEDKKSTPFVPSAFGNYFIGISCVALLLAYALMEVQFMRASNAKKSPAEGAKKVVAKGKAHIGGDWELIGTNGDKISNKNFQGNYYLIYFGFCNCPDICPNSLMKLSKALEKIRKTSDSKFFNIQSVFVSVDPDRDTPEKIQKFAKYFDKTMIGVTGKNNDDPALKDCMKKFKIYSSKIQFQDQDSVIKGRKSYTIDHTILTYLMNPHNEYLAHIGANLGEHDIAKLIIEKIKQDQRVSMSKLKV